ncbi:MULTISPECIES: DUF805 domain-containing protein [Acinetobacter]|uniref:DUF805 domain-containing protein n=1 Tax=Acinetobacter TaxID=469 RepID=UPI001445B73D|nr:MULTISPECIES: DUF805 domain-containing protein [Acinetobacter]MDM1486289.1 DUF805 domain-containing protein [Acinetobacter towneri]
MSQYIEDSALSAAGRFGRMSFLAWNCLLSFALTLLILVIAIIAPNLLVDLSSGSMGIGMILLVIIYIVAFYFSFIFTIRRLHDRNHTGWLSLLILVPVVNIILGLYLIFAPGDDRQNSYGAPRPTAGWEKVLAWIFIVLIILAILGGLFSGFMA